MARRVNHNTCEGENGSVCQREGREQKLAKLHSNAEGKHKMARRTLTGHTARRKNTCGRRAHEGAERNKGEKEPVATKTNHTRPPSTPAQRPGFAARGGRADGGKGGLEEAGGKKTGEVRRSEWGERGGTSSNTESQASIPLSAR